ncbi:MAG: UDP-2,4-diacetamido-2,4,6-trideoxy-beta-L-altropyranose hydrolase [Cycloclasticus sp.]
MQNILFRADSSSNMGTGHIMRDLVLAEQFEGDNVFFASQGLPGNINHKIGEKNYTLEILKSNDIEELIDLIKKLAINIIVVDHYGIDYGFEKALKEATGVTIFVLDDTYEKHHCDILLNHNIYADSLRYKNLVPENCELRCGKNFTLLREEFRLEKTKKRTPNKGTKNILIAMGGADHSNLNIEILKVLESFSNIHVNVVTTTANQYLKELQEYVKAKADIITLHVNTNQVASLVNKADIAIVTPSVTANEVFYMNTPFIAIKTAGNQDEMYKYLAKNNFLVIDNFDEIDLTRKIKVLFDSEKIELVNFFELSIEEKKMVLDWRNEPSIRQWMFDQEEISLTSHLNYIESLQLKKDRSYFLVKKNAHAIGVIDFTNIDYRHKTTEFGIYSNPVLKGVGNFLMEAIIDYAFNTLNVITLVSEVFEENAAAIKLYDRFCFENKGIKEVNNKRVLSMELKK